MAKNQVDKNPLYSLISLEDFKALVGADDREDKQCRFCLVTSTLNIERYCKRKLLRKKVFEYIQFSGDTYLPLNEYPVSEVLALFAITPENWGVKNSGFIEEDFYRVVPDCGTDDVLPYSIEISPAVLRIGGLTSFKIIYYAGYKADVVPVDLASACLELAAWNLNRYRGKRIGMTGNIKGAGIQGEHFEPSMPENVKALLEPYRRKTI